MRNVYVWSFVHLRHLILLIFLRVLILLKFLFSDNNDYLCSLYVINHQMHLILQDSKSLNIIYFTFVYRIRILMMCTSNCCANRMQSRACSSYAEVKSAINEVNYLALIQVRRMCHVLLVDKAGNIVPRIQNYRHQKQYYP